MISINDVVMPVPFANAPFLSTSRFLAVDGNDMAVLIPIDNGYTTGPFKLPFKRLQDALTHQEVVILKDFVIKGLVVSEDQLSKKGRKEFNKNKKKFAPLLDNPKAIFDDAERATAFENIVKKGVSPRKVRRTYYRYLGCGMNIFALAPMYKERGGPQQSTVRRKPSPEGSMVAAPQVSTALIDGVEKFVLKTKLTLKEAYVKTIKKHYKKKGIKFEDAQGNVLPLEDVLKQSEKLPSFGQFKYAYIKMKQNGLVRDHQPRHARPNDIKRAQRGSARDLLRGPCHRFEIDMTGCQTPLVSRFGRSLLMGSPNLYFVIDAWSGVITGYLLTLHAAGWPAASKALKNAFWDKGITFRRLNLNYTSDDWPCFHGCANLAADRGEMKNLKPECLVLPGGITLEIGPPMDPKWRGTVESTFKNIKHGDFYRIAGRHPKFSKRGDPDKNLSAALTLEEMEIIIVEKIMDLNNDPAPETIVPPDMMRDPDHRPSRMEMHKWGLIHRPGYSRSITEQDVITFLMTRDKASVTERGLYYKGHIFVCPRLYENGLLTRAANNGRFKIDIAYDEHFADVIWFFDPYLKRWIDAENHNEEVRRKWISFFEHELFQKDLRRRINAVKLENIHLRDQKAKRINKMTAKAAKKARLARAGKSKHELKIGIGKNRQYEMEVEDALLMAEALFSFGSAIKNARQDGRTSLKEAVLPKPQPAEPKTTSAADITEKLWRSKNGHHHQGNPALSQTVDPELPGQSAD